MVKYSNHRQPVLDTVFLALADPTRRTIIAALHHGEATVSELARPHRISLPAVMKHITVLERAGLLSHHKTGRIRRCRLVPEPMAQAADWIATYKHFWATRLDALDKFLQETVPPSESKSNPKNK